MIRPTPALLSLLLLVACAAPTQPRQPHEIIRPPAGKAVVYFLVDWPDGMRKPGCTEGPPFMQLAVDSMIFAELQSGAWTYLFVEPVPLAFYFSTRPVMRDAVGNPSAPVQCRYSWYAEYGELRKIREITPAPDSVHYLKFDWQNLAWVAASETDVHAMLDPLAEQCAGCIGRSYQNSLRVQRPPEGHYLSPKYEKAKCFSQCYTDHPDIDWPQSRQVCERECAEFMDD